MRRLVLGVIVTLLSCAAVRAQNAAVPPLERLIDIDYSLRLPVHECTVPSALAGLARRFHFGAGVEYLPVDCPLLWRHTALNGESVKLRGLTIGEALRKLSAMDPRYRWIEIDGLIVMRPLEAWADHKNILNYTTGTFTLKDATLWGALVQTVAAITGRPRDTSSLTEGRTEQGQRRFNLETGATSVIGVLDAVVRAHGDALWEVKLAPVLQNELSPVISFWTFDGSGVGTAVASATR